MNGYDNTMKKTKKRTDAYLTFPNKTILSVPIGERLENAIDYVTTNQIIENQHKIVAAVCNGKLRELTYQIEHDLDIYPISTADSDGAKIYRRSLVFLMTSAIADLYPKLHVSVNYALPDGGYFCEVNDHSMLSKEQLQLLERRMKELVVKNLPITKRSIPLDEAQALFRDRGEWDKVRLLEYRTRDTLTMYSLNGHDDYYYGYMVPSTSYLQHFNIIAAEGGFILQYPRREHPETMPYIQLDTKLNHIFQQADEWLEKLGVEDIGRLNSLVSQKVIQEIILVAEALHEQHVAQIATQICEKTSAGIQLILIAGPSSSGKTTFAKRLAIQLLANGLRPFTLEMDNYFIDREYTPRDESGDYDFESLRALNLERLNNDLLHLMDGEKVQLPRFDFAIGASILGEDVQITPGQIIIMEGIHGLNPELVPNIPQEKIFRIYVSALTQLNIDMHNRVPTTDVRLLRRIVRDARTRGWQAVDTLTRWRSVRRGEKRNIFPYQEHADVMFNSALIYELAAIRPLVEPLLLQVPAQTTAYLEANRLLSFLRWVHPMDSNQLRAIPDTSLLREFIGNSVLDQYHPSQLQTLIEHMR